MISCSFIFQIFSAWRSPLKVKYHIATTIVSVTAGLLCHAVVTIVSMTAAQSLAQTLIPATDPDINYYGRFSFATAAAPAFHWSGSAIEASFNGTTIGARLGSGGGGSYYDIEIDGVRQSSCCVVAQNTANYTFATDLLAGPHTVRIILRDETHWNIKTFEGFIVASGATLNPAPPRHARKIEFIGDSWTEGYGNERSGTTQGGCSNLQVITNENLAFPMLVAKAFSAQAMVIGWSGGGVVHNRLDSLGISENPVPYYYDSIFGEATWHMGSGLWNFSLWTADAVVICLGINDYTQGFPGSVAYENAYHALISRVLGHYPDAHILCVKTHSSYNGDSLDKAVDRIVAAEITSLGHARVNSVGIPTNLDLLGCDWHPSLADDRKLANTMIGKLMQMTGWDTAAAAGSNSLAGRQALRLQSEITVAESNTRRVVFRISPACAGNTLEILDMKGKLKARGVFNRCGVYQWNLSKTTPGVYLFGNKANGWEKVVVRKI